MKLVAVCLALVTSCLTTAHAQKIYVKVSGGAGISNKTTTDILINGKNVSLKNDNLMGFTAGVSAGIRKKNIDLSVGLQLLSTGEKIDDLTFEADPGLIETGDIIYRRSHLLIPIRVGYHLSLTKKLSLIPQIGVAYSNTFNTTGRIKTNIRDTRTTYRHTGTSGYHRSGIFGNAAIYAGYKLNRLLTVSAGPSCYFMISNFADAPASALNKIKEHPYMLGAEAAISIGL